MGQKPHHVAEPSSEITVRGTACAVIGRTKRTARMNNNSERNFMVCPLRQGFKIDTTRTKRTPVFFG